VTSLGWATRKVVEKWYHRDSYKDNEGIGMKPKIDDEIRQRIDNEIKGKVGVGTRTVAKNFAAKLSQGRKEMGTQEINHQRLCKVNRGVG